MEYLANVYQNQYMLVNNSISMSLEEVQELSAASKSLEKMDVISEKETLQSLGGDFYIKAAAKKNDTIIVGIGGGYLVEKDLKSARQIVEKRLESKNEMLNKLLKSKKELEGAIMELGSRLQRPSE